MEQEKVYDYYQERSVTAGDRAERLAWAFVAMTGASLIHGSLFTGIAIAAALSCVFMLLSALQALWQTLTVWILLQSMKRKGKDYADYPDWVGGGAWFFYWAKMVAIALATVAFCYDIVRMIV